MTEVGELKKARFFETLSIAREMLTRSKADRVVILAAVQLAFTDGWAAHVRYQGQQS